MEVYEYKEELKALFEKAVEELLPTEFDDFLNVVDELLYEYRDERGEE